MRCSYQAERAAQAMNSTSDQLPEQTPQATRRWRRVVRWHWQAVVAVLLVLIVMDGQPVSATSAASGLAVRAADAAWRVATPVIRPEASPSPSPSPSASADSALLAKADLRPDFQVSFAQPADSQPGTPLRYTVQVHNHGQGGGMVTVSTIVPLAMTNVRVSAPGFACTRRFTANGPQAGTMVNCTRNELDAGASAELTIEANAPSDAADYQLTVTADPRDETAETDESNNEADATISVRS
jgi:hypothetical protein